MNKLNEYKKIKKCKKIILNFLSLSYAQLSTGKIVQEVKHGKPCLTPALPVIHWALLRVVSEYRYNSKHWEPLDVIQKIYTYINLKHIE